MQTISSAAVHYVTITSFCVHTERRGGKGERRDGGQREREREREREGEGRGGERVGATSEIYRCSGLPCPRQMFVVPPLSHVKRPEFLVCLARSG